MATTATVTRRQNLQFNWLVVLVLLPASFFLGIWLHFNGLYGQEPHEIQRYMQALYNFLSGGEAPPAQNIPIVFPLAGAIAHLVIPAEYCLQFINMLAAAICYISFCRLLNQMYPDGTQRQRFAFLILFLSPFFFRAAVTGLPDMLSMSFVVYALLECWKWNRTLSSQSLILSITAGMLAVQTRYSTGLLLIPLLPMIWISMRSRLSLFLLIVFTILISLSPSILLKGQDGLEFLLHPWLLEWSPINLFRSSFSESGHVVAYTLPNIIYLLSLLLHPGFCIIGIIFIVYSIRSEIALPHSWTFGIALFLFFIGGLPVQDLRLLMPAFPLALLALYPAYESLLFRFNTRNQRVIIYLLAVAVQLALLVKVIRPVYQYQQEELIISNALKKMPAATLNTFAIDGALRSYNVPQEVINMWSTSYPLFNSGDLILYNRTRFDQQFKDAEPVIIFHRLRDNGRLIFLRSFPNGWELYRIKK